MPTTRDPPSRSGTPPIRIEDDPDDSFSSDIEYNANSADLRSLTSRTPFVASTSSPSNLNQNSLYPSSHAPGPNSSNTNLPGTSQCSTASATPLQSRTSSPQPLYIRSSSSSSDESGPDQPFLSNESSRRHMSRRDRPRWWTIGDRSRRRRGRDPMSWLRPTKRVLRRIVRHPFVPKTPVTIVRETIFFHFIIKTNVCFTVSPDIELSALHSVRCLANTTADVYPQSRQGASTLERLLYHTRVV